MSLQASFLMAAEYSLEGMNQETFTFLHLEGCNGKDSQIRIFI